MENINVVEKKNKRLGNISPEQKEIMIEYLKGHPELTKGKFSSSFTKAAGKTLWLELANLLNSTKGAKKEWYQWRKTWHDLRTNTKNKKATINKHRAATGGGKMIEDELTQTEEEVAALIGPTSIEGHDTIMESAVIFSFEDEQNISALNVKENLKPVPEISDHSAEHSSAEVTSDEPKSKRLNNNQPKRLQRLTSTIAANAKMVHQNEERISVMKDYYAKKLKLMAEDVEAKMSIAASLNKISEQLSGLID